MTMADSTPNPHSMMRRLIRPFEYRHLHAVGGVRLAAGGFQLGVGLVLASLGRQARTNRERRKCYGWAAWFLGMAALQLLGGCMDLTVASSERRRPGRHFQPGVGPHIDQSYGLIRPGPGVGASGAIARSELPECAEGQRPELRAEWQRRCSGVQHNADDEVFAEFVG